MSKAASKKALPEYGATGDEKINANISLKDFERECKEFLVLYEAAEREKQRAEIATKKVTAAKVKIDAYFEALDKENYRIEGHGLITRKEKWSFKMPTDPAKKKILFTYLKSRGHDIGKFLTIKSNEFNTVLNEDIAAAKRRGETAHVIPGVEEAKPYYTIAVTLAK